MRIVFSHDRELLDTLCTRSIFVHAGSITLRSGSYSQASQQVLLEQKSATQAKLLAKKEHARIEQEYRRRREEASRTKARRSGRMSDARDSDAREKRGRYIVSGQDGKAAKLSAHMAERLETTSSRLADMHVEKRYEGSVWIESEASKRPVLLSLPQQTIALSEDKSLSIPALYVGNSDHIGLVGANGSGKTSLIHKLIKELVKKNVSSDVDIQALSANEGEGRGSSALSDLAALPVLYIPQDEEDGVQITGHGEASPEASAYTLRFSCATALEELGALNAQDRGKVLSIIAQLNSDPDRVLQSEQLSPGELRKLMLALGILKKPQLIIVDEPTNHVDLGSVEAMERVLGEYPGALIVVSHDKNFIGNTTSIMWHIHPSEKPQNSGVQQEDPSTVFELRVE